MTGTPLERLRTALADRYAIEREIGVGGMATVYVARDLKHDRHVAIKVLRPELAAVIGAERFLIEIKTTANLQHPHILPLHDSGEVNGTVFYVMPYIEGESLRDRLTRERQLPIADAVRIATEVGQALDYAHRHGVIHRDIKPENILLHDGRALVADFGIALAATTAGSRMTETGMSLGTPHYMSPEQAMGERDLDARTDVYAVGCVLYEMLTGQTPFTGPTAQAIVAKVMTEKPALPSASRDTVPEGVEDVVMTALAKLPADRFASAGAMVTALNSGTTTGSMARAFRARPQRLAARAFWPTAAVLAVAVALWGWLRPAAPVASQPPSRLAVLAPNLGGNSTGLQRQLALSPDGSTLYYTVVDAGDNFTMAQPLDAETGTPIPGIPNFMADYVISQDGREIIAGSVYERKLVRFPVTGGTVRPVPDGLEYSPFSAYAADGAIWFSSRTNVDRGIARLAPDGSITRPFGTAHTDLSFTQILPGDRYALMIRRQFGVSTGPAFVLDLTNGEATPLIDVAMVDIRYTAGYLVYVLANGSLNAVSFDLATRHAGTGPVTIATNVSVTGNGSAQFVVANNGTVAYIPEAARSLVLVDRAGRSRPLVAATNNYHSPRFSPDGRRVAVDFTSSDGRDVWVVNVADGTMSRATFDRDGHDPTWTPDGRLLSYVTARGGVLGIRRQVPGSATTPDSLFTSEKLGWTGEWLRDGSALITAATGLDGSSNGDIALVTNRGAGPLEPVVASRFTEQAPDLSPDDKWLAFVSNQSGQNEVYVRALKGEGSQIQVSTDGGMEPFWDAGGRELYYRSGTREVTLVTATLAFDPTPRVTSRETLFPVMQYVTATPHGNFDVSPDGKNFVMVQLNPSSRIMVIQNLPALITALRGGGVAAR